MFAFNIVFVVIVLLAKLSAEILKFGFDEEFINFIFDIQEIGMIAIVIRAGNFLLFYR
jgi:hypothetical protein